MTRLHPPLLPTLCILALLYPSCADDAAAAEEATAAATFTAFQDALFRRDAATLRKLLCHDAREVVPGLCAAEIAGRKPLEIVKVTRRSYEFRVHVRDPNNTAPATSVDDSFYVVVKEDGEMRVDLLTTTRYQSFTRRTKLSKPVFVPEKLSPKKLAEIEAQQAAAPR